jgi:hypothetical protein
VGNFSKNPQKELADALDRDYVRVRFQQGKPALDRELNLAADLAAPQRLASRYLGNGIAVLGTDFAIANLNVGANEFTITAGRCLVNGLEAVLRANTTYRTQPNQGNVAPLPAGTSNVYLRVFEREITGQDDPLLGNPDDVTFETAVRNRVEWEVIVSVPPINAFDHLFLAVITTAPPTISDRRRRTLNLAAVRDELVAARGSAAGVGDRLNVAHGPTGSLLANSVGNAQIVAQAVTQDKIAPNAIAVAQLKRTQLFNAAVTLQANAETSVVAIVGNRHATLLTSVTVTNGSGAVTWREFVSQIVVNDVATSNRGVRVRNEGTTPLTVDVEVFELLAT